MGDFDDGFHAERTYRLIPVYCSHGDGGERSMGPVIGVFRDKAAAETFAKGKGWYGGDGGVRDRVAIELTDGRVYLLENAKPLDLDGMLAKYEADLKEQALKTLTPEEKRIFGIKE